MAAAAAIELTSWVLSCCVMIVEKFGPAATGCVVYDESRQQGFEWILDRIFARIRTAVNGRYRFC